MNSRPVLLLLAWVAAGAHAAPVRLTEAEVRGFVARQEALWNAGELAGYYGLFTPDARFRDQAVGSDNKVYPYGTSTLGEAQATSRRAFAKDRIRETATIRSLSIAPDGRSALIAADVVTTIGGKSGVRRSCARREQVVAATPSGLRSRGETDTVVRCR